MLRCRTLVFLSFVSAACGASERSGFEGAPDGSSSTPPDPGPLGPVTDASSEGSAVVAATTVVYANTDDALYALDPTTKALKFIGTFTGTGGENVTDCAVNAAGDVYVNTSRAIYRASLPDGGLDVPLAKIADISATDKSFFALAFVPAGVLGANEVLVGGDASGELWSIDPATGAAKDLGGFGKDGSRILALSGDLVFYVDTTGRPTGLATVRSCTNGGNDCTATNDYLVGIDMAALAQAHTSGVRASTLRGGIYGGNPSSKGAGIGHGRLFGLGAWQGDVYGFARASGPQPAALVGISPQTGAGTILPGAFNFTNGWSGACVTTKVVVTVPAPPAGPN